MAASQRSLKTVPRSSESAPRRQQPPASSWRLWGILKRLLCCRLCVESRRGLGDEVETAEKERPSLAANGDRAATDAAGANTAAEDRSVGVLKEPHAVEWDTEPAVEAPLLLNGEQLQRSVPDGGRSPGQRETELGSHGDGRVPTPDAPLRRQDSDTETSASDESRSPGESDTNGASDEPGTGGEPGGLCSEAAFEGRARLSSVQVEYDDVTIGLGSPPAWGEFQAGRWSPGTERGKRSSVPAQATYSRLTTAPDLGDILKRDDTSCDGGRDHHYYYLDPQQQYRRHDTTTTNNNNSSSQKNNNNTKRERLPSSELEAELDRKVSQLLKKHQVDLLQTYSPSNVMEIMIRHFRYSQEVGGLAEVTAGLFDLSREVCEHTSCAPSEADDLVGRSVRRVSCKRAAAAAESSSSAELDSAPDFQVSLEDSGDEALRLGHLVAQEGHL